MEERRIGPYAGQRAIPNGQAAGVGLYPWPRELPKPFAQHPEREVERDRPQPELPKLGRVAPGPCTEIEDRVAGAEPLGEALEPGRHPRAIAGVLQESRRDLVIGLARAIASIAHAIISPRA